MNILVTGASGFVGSAVVDRLVIHSEFTLRAALRQVNHQLPPMVDVIQVDDLAPDTDWLTALQGIDVVVHTAARVHVIHDTATDPLIEFRRVNVEGTLNLARQSAAAGVKRFVFISSIKVNGEGTLLEKPYMADDSPAPLDPYGISKMEAEKGLQQLAMEAGIEVVIIRPPLVYGPGVKANFALIMKWISRGVPLPLGAVYNHRSLVALDNLVDFIIYCIDHPKAANEVFLLSDGEDVSTTELLQKVAKAFGKKTRLIPVPVWLMTFVAKLVGKSDVANRLFGSLQVDNSKARDLLGWQPLVTMDEQLKKMVFD